MAQEKRKDTRVKEDFSILFRIFRQITLDGQISRIVDISKSGMAFIIDTRLTKDDILQIMLRIPPDFKEKIELCGRVVDISQGTDPHFKVRVNFIDIDASKKVLLANLIENAEIFKKKP